MGTAIYAVAVAAEVAGPWMLQQTLYLSRDSAIAEVERLQSEGSYAVVVSLPLIYAPTESKL